MNLKKTIDLCHTLFDYYYLNEDKKNVLGQIVNNLNTLSANSE